MSLTLTLAQAWEGGYPCVFKIGHAHGGLGKVKVENEAGFEVGFQTKAYPIFLTTFFL